MSVKFVFLIIKTVEGDIFGGFIDNVIYKSVTKFYGSSECFLFSFNEDKSSKIKKATLDPEESKDSKDSKEEEEKLEQICVGGMDYFAMGSGGDGPAIYLNESLQEGQTNCSDTFGNERLTSTKSHKFCVQNIEVILI